MNATDNGLRRGFRVALDALVRCRHAGYTGRVTWVSACGRHCRVLWDDCGKQTYESVCNLDAPNAQAEVQIRGGYSPLDLDWLNAPNMR